MNVWCTLFFKSWCPLKGKVYVSYTQNSMVSKVFNPWHDRSVVPLHFYAIPKSCVRSTTISNIMKSVLKPVRSSCRGNWRPNCVTSSMVPTWMKRSYPPNNWPWRGHSNWVSGGRFWCYFWRSICNRHLKMTEGT